VSAASEEGLLAIGGDLSPDRLITAYRKGIFPWYESGQPILWWSPDPRMVLLPSEFKLSKSLKSTLRKGRFHCTRNQAFEEVITSCAQVTRPGQYGTWITPQMRDAYIELNRMEHAHSIECWEDDRLVGGLYGVDLPEARVFCGESMFSLERDASKVAFHFLVLQLKDAEYRCIDCQVYTDHLASLGAREISRDDFITLLPGTS
jgi:leucyl/phenylalanyl-tRNA--protein transferase